MRRTIYMQDVPSVPVRAEPLGVERVQVGAPITHREARAIQGLARNRWSKDRRRNALRVLRRHGFRGMGRAELSSTPADHMRARLAELGVVGAGGSGSAGIGRVVHQVVRTPRGGFRGKQVVVAEQPGGPRGRCGHLSCGPGFQPTWNPVGRYCFCGNTRPLRHR